MRSLGFPDSQAMEEEGRLRVHGDGVRSRGPHDDLTVSVAGMDRLGVDFLDVVGLDGRIAASGGPETYRLIQHVNIGGLWCGPRKLSKRPLFVSETMRFTNHKPAGS